MECGFRARALETLETPIQIGDNVLISSVYSFFDYLWKAFQYLRNQVFTNFLRLMIPPSF